MIRIRDIMTRNVLTATPDMSLRDAMSLLCEHHVSGAPVVEGGKVVGVFSATDLLTYLSDLTDSPASLTSRRSGRRATPLEDVTVDDVMTRKVESLPPDCSVEEAAALMGKRQIHRVLVMMGDVLLGIVSMSDVAHAVAEERLRTRTYVFV
jgi:CBS domain-containing protein